jgi:hypothetical protein
MGGDPRTRKMGQCSGGLSEGATYLPDCGVLVWKRLRKEGCCFSRLCACRRSGRQMHERCGHRWGNHMWMFFLDYGTWGLAMGHPASLEGLLRTSLLPVPERHFLVGGNLIITRSPCPPQSSATLAERSAEATPALG